MNSVTVVINKRHIPLDHIALIEPFDPSAHPGMKTDKAFKARVVLIDRQSLLTEDALEAFAGTHAFTLIPEDQVAVNPAVRFGVETFVKTDGFVPKKDYRSRLLWRDLDGNTQSKLMLAEPEALLAVAVTGEPAPDGKPAEAPRTGGGRKPTASSMRPSGKRRRRQQPADEPIPF